MDEARVRASIEAYVAAWNSKRRLQGRGELDDLIADFQKRCPTDRAAFASAIDVQGGSAFDAGECDDDGRIHLLLTFAGASLPA